MAFELAAALPDKFSGLLGNRSMIPSSSLARKFRGEFPVHLRSDMPKPKPAELKQWISLLETALRKNL